MMIYILPGGIFLKSEICFQIDTNGSFEKVRCFQEMLSFHRNGVCAKSWGCFGAWRESARSPLEVSIHLGWSTLFETNYHRITVNLEKDNALPNLSLVRRSLGFGVLGFSFEFQFGEGCVCIASMQRTTVRSTNGGCCSVVV